MNVAGPIEQLVAGLAEPGPDEDQPRRVAASLADINAPATYVALGPMDTFTGTGAEAQVYLYLCAPALPELRAIQLLGPMLTALLDRLEALDLPVVGQIVPDVLPPAGGGEPLPALRVTTSLTV